LNNFTDAVQASRLVRELQQLANDVGYSEPLFIGIEYDGGLVRKLPLSVVDGWTALIPAMR
jgi:hypothetical protein